MRITDDSRDYGHPLGNIQRQTPRLWRKSTNWEISSQMCPSRALVIISSRSPEDPASDHSQQLRALISRANSIPLGGPKKRERECQGMPLKFCFRLPHARENRWLLKRCHVSARYWTCHLPFNITAHSRRAP